MTRLHDITFEGASLTGANGADSAQGSLTLDSASTIKGTYCSRGTAAGDFSRDDNTASNSHYVSALIKITTLPASGQGRVLFIRNGTVILCSLRITSAGKVQLRNSANTQIGSDSTKVLSTGTIYRIGLRYTKGTGADGILEGYVVDDGAAWGSPFASTSSDINTTTADRVEAGQATGGTSMDIFFDNIRIDDTAMPTDDIAGTTYNQSVNVTVGNSITIPRQTNKIVTITEGNTTSVIKRPNKTVSITEGNSVTLSRQTNKSISITAGNIVSLLKQVNKSISATVGNTVTRSIQTNKIISAAVSNTVSLTKQTNKIITITSNVIIALSKLIGKTISTTVGNVVDIATQFIPGGGTTFTKTIDVVVTNSVAISRGVQKTVTIPVTVVTSIQKSIRKTVNISVSVVVQLAQQFIQAAVRTGVILQYIGRNIRSIAVQRSQLTGTISLEHEGDIIEIPPDNTATIETTGMNDGEL